MVLSSLFVIGNIIETVIFLFFKDPFQEILIYGYMILKVNKIENFFGSEFEFYTISLLVMLKY